MTSTRRGLPRWLWEFLILVLIGAVAYGLWTWLGIEHRADLQAQKDALATAHQEEMAEMSKRLRAAISAEATATAVAFAAGVETLAAEERWDAVDRAVLDVLELPDLAFIHVLGPDGSVKVSSDRKLLATGEAGPRARWALDANGVSQRSSMLDTIEIAVPLGDAEKGKSLVVWLGYRATPVAAPKAPAPAASEPAGSAADSEGGGP